MTLNQAIEYIHAAREQGVKTGLDNMTRLCALLGDPQNSLRAVHVAGTNGKGSTCACLESVLRAAGYRVGLYTSPFLQHYTERIRIDGLRVDEAAFFAAFDPVHAAVEALRAEGLRPTPFEIGTALAFLAFAQADADLCVIEVGLGGRFDPTNVLTPLVCAIASIGLDHQAILGDTLPDIAGEKAGIMKPGVPVVTAAASPEIEAVFAARAAEVGAPWRFLTGDEMKPLPADPSMALVAQHVAFACDGWVLPELWLRLLGAHQLRNAALALAALAELKRIGLPISDEAVVQGLARVRWPGRLEYVAGAPAILLDGAHNAQGAQALAAFAKTLPEGAARVLLCGVLEEKLSPEMLGALAELAPRAAATAPQERRAVPPEALAGELEQRGVRTEVCGDAASALAQARAIAGAAGIVIVAGSLYLVGEVRALLCEEGAIRDGI